MSKISLVSLTCPVKVMTLRLYIINVWKDLNDTMHSLFSKHFSSHVITTTPFYVALSADVQVKFYIVDGLINFFFHSCRSDLKEVSHGSSGFSLIFLVYTYLQLSGYIHQNLNPLLIFISTELFSNMFNMK